MNRPTAAPRLSPSSRWGPLCLAALLFLAQDTLWAQQRRPVALPDNATYGELKAFSYPEARIGNRIYRLGPGARIYDTRNLIVLPASMPSRANVLYRLDFQGQIQQMWLLTADEARARAPKTAPKPKPTTPAPTPAAPEPKPKEGKP